MYDCEINTSVSAGLQLVPAPPPVRYAHMDLAWTWPGTIQVARSRGVMPFISLVELSRIPACASILSAACVTQPHTTAIGEAARLEVGYLTVSVSWPLALHCNLCPTHCRPGKALVLSPTLLYTLHQKWSATL